MAAQTTILHFGSYWMGANDIVNLMQGALARLPNVNLVEFDARLYDGEPSPYVTQEEGINWIKDEVVSRLVAEHKPSILICSAGGLSPTIAMHQTLKRLNITTVGIALSDPDDFPRRSLHFAKLFDLFYTNTIASMDQYRSIHVDVRWLPFGADTVFHRPLSADKTCDVVVVGAMRPERLALINAMRKKGIVVHCYGAGWESAWERQSTWHSAIKQAARRVLAGLPQCPEHQWGIAEVHGQQQVEAINSGFVYLSFAATTAGYINLKVGVFEAAACGVCVLVRDYGEVRKCFRPTEEIVTYANDAEAVEKALLLCKNRKQALAVGRAAHARVLAEHTWEHRWNRVLSDVEAFRLGNGSKETFAL